MIDIANIDRYYLSLQNTWIYHRYCCTYYSTFQAFLDTGNLYFFWGFTTPKIIVRDPELIKEVLTNKCGQFQPLPLSPSHRISRGLPSLHGDKWIQHRGIITPAFHLTKLKVIICSLLRLIHLQCNLIGKFILSSLCQYSFKYYVNDFGVLFYSMRFFLI